jgi:nitroreductase
MSHPLLDLSNDELLSSTRAVRKRLDFSRPVARETLEECMQLATQAPTGSNAQGWQFMFVTDADKKKRIGEIYQQMFSLYRDMPMAIHKLNLDTGSQEQTASQTRSASSADYLADHMAEAPVLMIPCIAGRVDRPESNNILAQSATWGSIIPAAWSFMLAARARGLGTAWTTLHLMQEAEVAELLGIPYEDYTQVALIPIAYTKGTDFKPAFRPPVSSVMHFDNW